MSIWISTISTAKPYLNSPQSCAPYGLTHSLVSLDGAIQSIFLTGQVRTYEKTRPKQTKKSYTPKDYSNIEPKNDGLEDDFPFPC